MLIISDKIKSNFKQIQLITTFLYSNYREQHINKMFYKNYYEKQAAYKLIKIM